jgi:DNA-binding beta-propeller fold protein YncE
MAVDAQTIETYDNTVIREDLEQQYTMISPEETPFQTAIGVGPAATNTYHEWTVVELASPSTSNRVIEGDDAPGEDNGTLGKRFGNYTQISDKIVSVSNTSEAVDAAAENVQRLAAQVAIKLKEMKRDMEAMLLQNIAAAAGSSGTARQAAGLPAWLRTNIVLGASGAAPTLSGTTSGYPNAALTPGTAVVLTETNLNNVIQSCWNEGASPSIIMVNANNKRVISKNFTGNATRYKDAIDKRLTAAIDIYDSDFGELSVVPNRFQQTTAADNYSVYVLDPEYASLSFLETPRQTELAQTGHAKRRMVHCEYTLKVSNEKAHGAIHATTGAAA